MTSCCAAGTNRDLTYIEAYQPHLGALQTHTLKNHFTYIRDFLPRRDLREKRTLKPQLNCRAVQTRLRPSHTRTLTAHAASPLLHSISCTSVLLLTLARPRFCPDVADGRICLADKLQPRLCFCFCHRSGSVQEQVSSPTCRGCYKDTEERAHPTTWVQKMRWPSEVIMKEYSFGSCCICINYNFLTFCIRHRPAPTLPSHHSSSSATFPSRSTGSVPREWQRTSSTAPRYQPAYYTTQ